MVKRTNYKTAILEYLNSNAGKDIKRDDICNKLGISKPRLSEILDSIRADGYTIITPNRSGIVRFQPDENQTIFPTIKDYDIRRWIILFILSRNKSLSFLKLTEKIISLCGEEFDLSAKLPTKIQNKKMQKQYDDIAIIKAIRKASDEAFGNYHDVAKDLLSVPSLRKDLSALISDKLVTVKHNRYNLATKGDVPHIITKRDDNIETFCSKHNSAILAAAETSPLKQAYARISRLIDFENIDAPNRVLGKTYDIDSVQRDAFHAFISHPYATNLLNISNTYTSALFATGLIYYSVETACFYALGRNLTLQRVEARRLDRITAITDSTKPNNEYCSKEIKQIYGEIFATQYEETSYHVKVLFSDFGQTKKRFETLCDVRSAISKASIRPIKSIPDGCEFKYVYEDTIRGLDDFARYLRSFGRAVLAVEPIELREKLINTYTQLQRVYGGNNE